MPTGPFTAFLDALRAFESGVNPETIGSGYARNFVTADEWQNYQDGKLTMTQLQYKSVNSLGFVGYQVGEAVLIDTGYYSDSFFYGNGDSMNRWDGAFTGKDGVNSFASLKTNLQETMILAAFGKNLEYLDNYFAGWPGHTIEEFVGTSHTYTDNRGQQVTANYTWTGMLAAAHLRGAGGLFELMKNGSVTSDENGTSIITYINKFGGYDFLGKATLKNAFQQGTNQHLAETTWNADFDGDGDIGGVTDGGGDPDPVVWRGQAGNQHFDGTGVIATVDFTRAAGAMVVDLSLTTPQILGSGQGRDRFTDIENLIGSRYDDTLSGNAAVNHLEGGKGNDTLDGRGGADIMEGGLGDDTYVVDNAGDQVIETATGGTDTVRSSVDYSLRSTVENLVLTGTGDIDGAGNRLNNSIIGNDGVNVLDGGIGADMMAGGAGNDTYIVDNVGDQALESGSGGVDTVISSISYTLDVKIENLTLSGTDNLSAVGSRLANVIVGNDGKNTIEGGMGNDTLTGGGNKDWFVFNTALNATTNVDTITDFSVADDTIQLARGVFSTLSLGKLSDAAFHIGASAADAQDRVIYNSTTGALSYDADGVGGAAAVRFASLDTGLAMTSADFLVV